MPPVRHEPSDVAFGAMLALFALILSVLLLMLGTAYWLFPQEVQDRRFARPFPDYPAPRLQPSPAVDMSVFHAREMRQLNSAGWQDQGRGIVHIPIGQAMGEVAREGIPGWPTGAAASEGARR